MSLVMFFLARRHTDYCARMFASRRGGVGAHGSLALMLAFSYVQDMSTQYLHCIFTNVVIVMGIVQSLQTG
jgi:hypothetical protein